MQLTQPDASQLIGTHEDQNPPRTCRLYTILCGRLQRNDTRVYRSVEWQPLMLGHCAKYGIDYKQHRLVQPNGDALSHSWGA